MLANTETAQFLRTSQAWSFASEALSSALVQACRRRGHLNPPCPTPTHFAITAAFALKMGREGFHWWLVEVVSTEGAGYVGDAHILSG